MEEQMEKQIKISVIMPVYKVEQYVGKAIESILNQTLAEFEFLIVDDGTPDKSGEICDEYAKKDSRIRVLHKENGGAPSARNMAMDLAKGKYLYFLDSDDWAEPGMLKELYGLAEKHSVQMVISGFYIDTYYDRENYITNAYIPGIKGLMSKEDFRKNAYKLFDNNMLYPPWNKLYLRSYIQENKLYFPSTMWDDFPFNLSVIRDIARVYVTKRPYYHFLRVRSESETARYLPAMYEKREEEHGWMKELYQYWNIDDPLSREMIARRYIERLIGCFENLTNPRCVLNGKEKRKEIKRMLKTEQVRESIKRIRPKSVYMKMMCLPIRWNSIWLVYWEASLITLVKSRNVKLFSELKNRR